MEFKNDPLLGGNAPPVDLEMKAMFENLNKNHQAFIDSNEARLKEIEKKGTASAELEMQVKSLGENNVKLQKELQDLQLKMARPEQQNGNGHQTKSDPFELERKQAIVEYLKTGRESKIEAWTQKAIETKALAQDSGPDGGYLIRPTYNDNIIDAKKVQVSPIRAIADVQTINSNELVMYAYENDEDAFQWAGESTARNETNNPQFKEIKIPLKELSAMPAATQRMIDDMTIDIESWITEKVNEIFSKAEGKAFINGNGATQPWGFLQKTTALTPSWGTIQHVITGEAAGFTTTVSATTAPADCLKGLAYNLKSEYRTNGKFVMNSMTMLAVQKFKDTTGQYIFQPSLQAGQPPTLLGYPVVTCEDMPDLGSGTYPIAFADWQSAYTIADRLGVRTLRDPFTAKPKILFYTTKRVGGDVRNYEAIKLLKCST